MRRSIRFVVAAAVAAAVVAPVGVRADEQVCDDTIRVFSFYSVDVDDETSVRQPNSADLGGVSCLVVTEGDGVDGRFIQPGANIISVSVDLNPPEDAEPIFGTVTHPDGTVTEIELTPGLFVDDTCCRYRSPAIDVDPTARGYYKVAIEFFGETLTDTYRTVGTPSDKAGYLP